MDYIVYKEIDGIFERVFKAEFVTLPQRGDTIVYDGTTWTMDRRHYIHSGQAVSLVVRGPMSPKIQCSELRVFVGHLAEALAPFVDWMNDWPLSEFDPDAPVAYGAPFTAADVIRAQETLAKAREMIGEE